MELLHRFKKTLIENGSSASKITVKNYISDVRKFIVWYESTFNRKFNPSALPTEIVERYLAPLKEASPRSAQRYTSSLRKFCTFLVSENVITYNPLVLRAEIQQPEDLWQLREFDNHLYNSKTSPITRKNYINDVNQFISWVNAVTIAELGTVSNQTQVLANLSTFTIERYKNRLLHEAGLSPITINRKLSSLRKYISFAKHKGLLKKEIEVGLGIQGISFVNPNLDQLTNNQPSSPESSLEALRNLQQDISNIEDGKNPEYSKHAPIRLAQKTHKGLDFLFDSLVILSIVKGIEATKYNLWKATGKQIFQPLPEVIKSLKDAGEITSGSAAAITRQAGSATNKPHGIVDNFITQGIISSLGKFRGIPKSVYAPTQISTRPLSFWGKTTYTIRHARPNWYKKYHTLSSVRYLHIAIMIFLATFVGFKAYQATSAPKSKVAVLSSNVSPNRIIAFQGVLRDDQDTPITKESLLRFAIYNNPTASGSALLWQETQRVNPDASGRFSASLGKVKALSQNIFVNNPNMFLGISIGSNPELFPRQELANAALSKNSQELQGLKPITGNNAQTENVILALDSSGNLTIGGSGSPIFQATGGEFKFSGQQLTLATNEGSNTNIVLSPDGTGIIDVQKPLQNTSDNNNSPDAIGAVEIDDNLAILASSSAQSALIINQNASGDLISASTAGSAKFSVSNSGSVKIAEDLEIFGNNIKTTAGTFSLANSDTLNLNIGGAAIDINLGSETGKTTINHNLNVKGKITASGGIVIPELKEGSIPFMGATGAIMADNLSFFWDATNKRLGIGTQTPSLKLDVQDANLSGGVAQIFNTAGGSATVGMNIKLGTTFTPQSGNRWINFMDGNGAILGKIRGNNSSNTVTFDSNGGDFAEYFIKADQNEAIGPGDLLCHSSTQGVEKCKDTSNGIVGIFSDNAGFVGAGGHENDPKYILVGLIGQLNIKISSDSEAIKPGDPITLSNKSGLGTKATKAGQIVGRALEAYDPSTDIRPIKISLNVSWYDPSAVLMNNGGLAAAFENSNIDQPEANISAKTAESIQKFADTLEAGVLEIKTISTTSLHVVTEDITIGTKTLREYISSIVNEILDKRLAEKEPKTVIVVSPLARTSIDQSSSATLEPTSTPSAQPTPTPSLNPTPTASPSSNVTNIINIYNSATPSAIKDQSITPAPSPIDPTPSATTSAEPPIAQYSDINSSLNTQPVAESAKSINADFQDVVVDSGNKILNTQPANIATFSAELSYVPSLKSDFATFNQGLIALGPTSLTETSINGDLTIGRSMKISESSINTIGTDLNLQPLRQGNLSIMGGLVNIDMAGNLTVEGNATFAKDVKVKGKFAANIIAPVPGQDLILGLDDKEGKSKIEVKNASGSGVLSVNQLGDIISSGSAQFKNFKIVRGAQADTSFTETVASGSAGTAVIITNEIERTIVSPFITENSLIYLTAASDTKGVTPYIARQTAENQATGSRGSFTIQIPQSQTIDIKLNWWIVN